MDQALEVVDQAVGAPVELLVEPLDGLLVEDVGMRPLAVGAAEGDLPALAVDLAPLDGVDELRVAVAANVEPQLRGLDLGFADRIVEVDDLDRLSARKSDPLDPLALFPLLPGFHLQRTYRPGDGEALEPEPTI